MILDTARCPSCTAYLRPCGPDTYLDYCTTCLRPFVIAPMPFRTAGPRTYMLLRLHQVMIAAVGVSLVIFLLVLAYSHDLSAIRYLAVANLFIIALIDLTDLFLTLRLKNKYRSVMPPQAQPSKIYWKAFNGIMCMMLAIVGLIY